MKIEGRFRPSALRDTLQSTLDDLKQKQTYYTIGAMVMLGGLACFLVLLFLVMSDPGLGIFCAVGSLMVSIVVLVMVFQGLGRQVAKATFALGLLDELYDDLHPARKSTYRLDLSSYDAGNKRYWSGRSAHGNAKHRYDDRWLRHKFQLVDGTTVVLERRADVKTRKGGIQKEKRRLYLKVRPNPATFGPVTDAQGLDELVRQRVKEGFHDPPEQIRIDPKVSDDGLRVRISQWDAPIREHEAFQMVETVLLYLQMRG